MSNKKEIHAYRRDIDGLRAIAVLAVLIFHFGFLPNGYLGVDIFFVISGYLITNIIYNESLNGTFSIVNFYFRRTRRIIPLVSTIGLVSLLVGFIVMLPDDLENLAQSIIATNFFANNILQAITTANYWDLVNEYKPLMHTWSLGIEEQYYLFYPLIFLVFKNNRIKWIMPLLTILTLLSLGLYFSAFTDANKFYLLPFRFFELSIGGIGAIVFNNRLIPNKLGTISLGLLVTILCFKITYIPENVSLCLTVLLSICLLVSAHPKQSMVSWILESNIMVSIGKISFSLYMWHQVVLSFVRYFILSKINIYNLFFLLIIIFILSFLTYYFVEQPFRKKDKIGNKALLLSLGVVTLMSSLVSLFIYSKAGVFKDVYELDISQSKIEKNMHAKYNDRVFKYVKDFEDNQKTKILVIGNSFGRDWVNVLLESKYKEKIDISYISHHTFFNTSEAKNINKLSDKAEIIFVNDLSKSELRKQNIEISKVYCLGAKNFGTNNGIYYNYKGSDYCYQRTTMEKGYLERNFTLKSEWGKYFIDFIGHAIDKKGKMPVFTPDCKFISQDCWHFTEAGAKYFSEIFDQELYFILGLKSN
jgi:peptidoglycan/LPS O-acetylase OafA/YrhL